MLSFTRYDFKHPVASKILKKKKDTKNNREER